MRLPRLPPLECGYHYNPHTDGHLVYPDPELIRGDQGRRRKTLAYACAGFLRIEYQRIVRDPIKTRDDERSTHEGHFDRAHVSRKESPENHGNTNGQQDNPKHPRGLAKESYSHPKDECTKENDQRRGSHGNPLEQLWLRPYLNVSAELGKEGRLAPRRAPSTTGARRYTVAALRACARLFW
jgi:hypothetical protein